MEKDPEKFKQLLMSITREWSTWVDSLPEYTPFRDKLKETVAPISNIIPETIGKDKCRIYLFGRTGSGKSSLLNAISGKYVVEVGTGTPKTKKIEEIIVEDCNAIFYDTKGLEKPDPASKETGFLQILEYMKDKSPDVILLCIQRSDLRDEGSGIELLIKGTEAMVEELRKMNPNSLPIVIVALTKVDEDQNLTRSQIAKMNNPSRDIRKSVIDELKQNTKALWEDRKQNSDVLKNAIVEPVYTPDQSTEEKEFGFFNEVENLVELINGSQTDLSKIILSRRKSMFENVTHVIANHIIKTACALNSFLFAVPLPAVDAVLAAQIMEVMLKTLSILSYDEKRTYETYRKEHKNFIAISKGFGGATSAAVAFFQALCHFSFGTSLLISTAIGVGAGLASTAALGNHAKNYFFLEL